MGRKLLLHRWPLAFALPRRRYADDLVSGLKRSCKSKAFPNLVDNSTKIAVDLSDSCRQIAMSFEVNRVWFERAGACAPFGLIEGMGFRESNP